MPTRTILARWVTLERGNGIEQVRRVSRYLSIGVVVLCALVGLAAAVVDLRCLVVAIPSAAIGWLVAERNALQSRMEQWPIFRQYIDWSRVDEDLQGEAKSN